MEMSEQDLTVGNVTKKLIKFGTPLLLANLLQSLYSIVDMLVVGRVVGSIGIAAISNASMISFIINSICIGITMGGTVLVAQYKGANDEQGQKETVGTLFSISAIAAVIITILGISAYKPIFMLLNVPSEAMKDACEYMLIICVGTIFVFGYNAVCSIMRGFGNSRSPLYFVALATLIHIILDILLVGPMELGTKGAALATIVSQGISFFVSIVHLRRHKFVFDFKLKSFAIKADKMKIILRVGVPSAIQMVVVNVSYLLITGMLNVYGVAIAAASGIGLKVCTFAGMPCWAVGQAVSAMVGQNMGAGKIQRVESTTKIGLRLNLFVTLLAVIIVQLYAESIIMLFDPLNSDVVKEGILYLRICCSVNSLIYATMYTYDAFATGIGVSTLAMCNSFLDAVVVRLFFSWILGIALGYGFIGIYIGQALSPILPAIVGLIYFRTSRWRKRKLIQDTND